MLKSNTTNSILDLENKWYELPAGWYVVEGDVTITPRVDTQGEVNLILKDGSHLTAEWGINVKKGDTFTVYAQSTGEDTMGKLTACLPEDFNSDGSVDYVVWPDEGLSGIGGGVRWKKANNGIYESEGTIVINGGNIRARGQNRASAIGGTFQDHADVASSGYSSEKRLGGSITINGGTITATGGINNFTGTFDGADHTLTVDEADKAAKKILDAMERELGITIRQ